MKERRSFLKLMAAGISNQVSIQRSELVARVADAGLDGKKVEFYKT